MCLTQTKEKQMKETAVFQKLLPVLSGLLPVLRGLSYHNVYSFLVVHQNLQYKRNSARYPQPCARVLRVLCLGLRYFFQALHKKTLNLSACMQKQGSMGSTLLFYQNEHLRNGVTLILPSSIARDSQKPQTNIIFEIL